MDIDAFIARWTSREGGAERANYQMFLAELCDVLRVPRPDPAGAERERNDYVFERAVRPRADVWRARTVGKKMLPSKHLPTSPQTLTNIIPMKPSAQMQPIAHQSIVQTARIDATQAKG